jgi:hypothetical protein
MTVPELCHNSSHPSPAAKILVGQTFSLPTAPSAAVLVVPVLLVGNRRKPGPPHCDWTADRRTQIGGEIVRPARFLCLHEPR